MVLDREGVFALVILIISVRRMCQKFEEEAKKG